MLMLLLGSIGICAHAEGLQLQTDSASVKDGALYLNLKSDNFFKNNEYFGDYAEGYTLPGYRLAPTLQCEFLHNTLSLEAGAEWVQFWGLGKVHRFYPVVSAVWKPTEKMSMRIGTIDNSGMHNLHEAILDPESRLTDRPETGAQFRYANDIFSGEVYIDWFQFIKRGDTIPEKFMAGICTQFTPLRNGKLKIPFNITAQHLGGQISDFRERMQSLANVQAGIHYDSEKIFYASVDMLLFKVLTGKDVRPTTGGWGIDAEFGARYSIFHGQVGYWHSDDYFGWRGMPLLMCISNYKPEVYTPIRNVLKLDFGIEKQISSYARFALNFRAYHDIDASQFEYSYGFSLNLTPRWLLKKF